MNNFSLSILTPPWKEHEKIIIVDTKVETISRKLS